MWLAFLIALMHCWWSCRKPSSSKPQGGGATTLDFLCTGGLTVLDTSDSAFRLPRVCTLSKALERLFLLLASAMIWGTLVRAGFFDALVNSGFPVFDTSPRGFLPPNPLSSVFLRHPFPQEKLLLLHSIKVRLNILTKSLDNKERHRNRLDEYH